MNKIRLLFSVLDWGLGHASRCVPVIEELIALEVEVIIAGSGNSQKLLQAEFPNLEFISLENYPITYPKKSGMFLHMLLQFPAMRKHVKKENNALASIIEKREITAVISDNRYGLHNVNVPCVFITHQVHPPLGVFSHWMHKFLAKQIEQFDHCWIVDFDGKNAMAGKLSDKKGLKINVTHLGALSRFKKKNLEKQYDVLAILSGPEPQRTLLENALFEQLSNIEGKHLLIRGIDNAPEFHGKTDRIEVIGLLQGNALEKLIHSSNHVISRSGYSSIMDYLSIGKKAILIPTPGQPEQEYLAKRHQSSGHFVVQTQAQLNLKKAIIELNGINDPPALIENKELKSILQDFIEALY